MMPFRKLKPHELETTEALIAAIERKDRRFRFFQTMFMIGTFIVLILIIGAQQRILDGLQKQLTQAKETAQAQSKQSDESQAKIERRLDCMVVFFSQRDRTNLSIADIDKCTLNRDGDAQRFFRDDPDRGTITTPNEQPSNLTPSTTPQGQGVVPSQNNGGNQVEDGNEVEERPPVALDLPVLPPIPLCVPITGICVR